MISKSILKFLLFSLVLIITNRATAVEFKDHNKGEDNLDFLLKTKKIVRDDSFVDRETGYTDFDMIMNYSEGDELTFVELAGQSGVLDDLKKQIELFAQDLTEDDLVLGLGRAATMFIIVLDILRPQIKSALLPYSGTPDAMNIRKGTTDNDDNRRNLLTPENLQIYKNEILAPHLEGLRGRLFIVDIIGTGTGLNSFLRVLRKTYPEILPRTKYVSLILDPTKAGTEQDIIQRKIVNLWQWGPKQKKLSLAALDSVGRRSIVVDTIPLGRNPRSTIMADNKIIKHFFSPFGAFPPCNWTKQFVEEHINKKDSKKWQRFLKMKEKFRALYALAEKEKKTLKELLSARPKADHSFLTKDPSLAFLWGKGENL